MNAHVHTLDSAEGGRYASTNGLRMTPLGEEFRCAREARGLSHSAVAEQLHIRSVFLAAIEDEDWSSIGAPVYIRGFMRTYARFLKLDPEAAVARFIELDPDTDSPSRPPAVTTDQLRRGGLSIAAMLAMLVASILVGFVGYKYLVYWQVGRAVTASSASLQSRAAPLPTSGIPGLDQNH
jgi:cytoskeleton protein RodZ